MWSSFAPYHASSVKPASERVTVAGSVAGRYAHVSEPEPGYTSSQLNAMSKG